MKSYLFEQIVFASDRIFRKEPEPIRGTHARTAIIIHLFYPDIWEEIYRYLSALDMPYDLYVTLPKHIDESDAMRILQACPQATLYTVENRGRDVLPFLLVMNHIGIDTYTYLCKLHTKKTGESPLGSVWRKMLYFDLIGSPETVTKTMNLFAEDPNIGQITGRHTILDSQRYAYGNNTKIKQLCEAANIPFSADYTFAGGTMFWTRSKLLAPLLTLFQNGELDFEEERGQKDHTVAHAIERFLGILVQQQGMYIAPSPADYAALPVSLTEETASLVLSQQYAGQDIFEKVNELIDEMQALKQYAKEMETLAESMRLKNRLKNLPSEVIKHVRTKLGKETPALPKPSAAEKFSTAASLFKANPAAARKLFYYLKRGEFRYMWEKLKEKMQTNLRQSGNALSIDPKRDFISFDPKQYALPEHTRINIIIPVYNGYDFLEILFNTLKENTSHPYRLIVVNDASPDERVLPYLQRRLSEFDHATLLDNEENLGFVRSVNRAVEKAEGHFVILNTDTELPPFWLERLMYPVFHMPKVASTTPFTNSGTIASFPKFLEDNPIFEALSVTQLDSMFQKINPIPYYAHLPTGVGFCMGVNYDVVQEIGFFDIETFGKGYGEENDWCQRAIEHGYTNILVPNLFVYHKHGGSFPSVLKQKLLEENYSKLLTRHPDYDKQVQRYIQQDPHHTLRKLLVLTASSLKKPMWIMFDHALGGGANHYADALVENKHAEGENTLMIRFDFYTNKFSIHHRYKSYESLFSIDTLNGVEILLEQLRVDTVFLNSLVSYTNSKEILEYLEHFINRRNIDLIIPLHDFYAVCPSYTLLNDTGTYCDIPDIQTCRDCMGRNRLEWKTYHPEPADIDTWRLLWDRLLHLSSSILCFSQSSKEILLKAYPGLESANIEVLPHKVTDMTPLSLPPKEKDAPFTVGVLGAINYAKGAAMVKDLVSRIDAEDLNINVVVIGEITEPIESPHYSLTGKYQRNILPEIIQHYHVDLFFIPSIWPETFSYTAEEIMQMELPLMVFDLGAPAERVKMYDKGYIIDEVSADAVLRTVTKAQQDNTVV